MKHLQSFKLFEGNGTYAPGDQVVIRYYLTGDPVPVKIKEVNGNTFIVSFDCDGNYFRNAPDMSVNASAIVGMYKADDSPAFPDSFNSQIIRGKSGKISNDIAIHNYPKTL